MTSALIVFYLTLLGAGVLFLAGVYVLCGAGFALVSASLLLFAFAGFIRNGLTARG